MNMKCLSCLLTAALVSLGGWISQGRAGVLQDDVNGSATPGFFVFFNANSTNPDANIGWIYSPTTAYNLDRIETTFRAVPNASAFTRPVTLSIWDELPQLGGSILKTGVFNVGQGGGSQGISFSEFALTAGEDYFVSLQNINGLGINIVQPINNDFAQGQPVGTEFLDGWYSGNGSSFSTFVPLATGNPNVPNNPFAAPILRFYGSPIAPVGNGEVPEPTSVVILAGLSLFALVRHHRRSLSTASSR